MGDSRSMGNLHKWFHFRFRLRSILILVFAITFSTWIVYRLYRTEMLIRNFQEKGYVVEFEENPYTGVFGMVLDVLPKSSVRSVVAIRFGDNFGTSIQVDNLREFSNLRSIAIANIDSPNFRFLASLPRVHRLEIFSTNLTNCDVLTIMQNATLVEVRFLYCEFESLTSVSNEPFRNDNLRDFDSGKKLELFSCENEFVLFRLLNNNPSVSQLEVSSSNISEENIHELPTLPSLTRICLRGLKEYRLGFPSRVRNELNAKYPQAELDIVTDDQALKKYSEKHGGIELRIRDPKLTH